MGRWNRGTDPDRPAGQIGPGGAAGRRVGDHIGAGKRPPFTARDGATPRRTRKPKH